MSAGQSRRTAQLLGAEGGREGDWGRYLGRCTHRAGCRRVPAQPSPQRCCPSPARRRRVTFAPGSAPQSSGEGAWGRPPPGPGWAGGSRGLRGGGPSPPPLPEGRGGRRPARPRLPAPPAAAAAGPAAALPGLRGSLRACHFLPGREGGGGRPGAAGRAGGGGWRGGASGAADPSPGPPPPRGARAPAPRASLASCRRPLP